MNDAPPLTDAQLVELERRVDVAKENPEIQRIARILRTAPLHSDQFDVALTAACMYGASAEICAIWSLATARSAPDPNINIIEEIMEDTYEARVLCIHGSDITGLVLRFFRTPPK
jgi:hypothetical protein